MEEIETTAPAPAAEAPAIVQKQDSHPPDACVSRPRSSQQNNRNRHQNRGNSNSGESTGSKPGLRSRSIGRRHKREKYLLKMFPEKAKKLPQPHKIAYLKSGSKKRITATDISGDEFFANNLRIAACLAKQLSGDFSDTMSEYLEYLEFVASARCDFSDDAVLNCDDKFRRPLKDQG